jgi:hypothetical protein
MPTCFAPSSVQLNSQFFLPIGMTRRTEVVGVDRYFRVIQVDRQAEPALADIRQRTKEWAARQESLLVELLVDPGEEALEDRFRLFLTACVLGLARMAAMGGPWSYSESSPEASENFYLAMREENNSTRHFKIYMSKNRGEWRVESLSERD